MPDAVRFNKEKEEIMKKLLIFLSALSLVVTLFAQEACWTYTEEGKDHNSIGYGYITDGVWKLYAKRNAKNSLDLYVSASGGEFYGDETKVYPVNLTNIYNSDRSEKYTAKKFGRFTHRYANSYLYNYKERLSEFIAPECVSLEGGSNNGYNFSGCTSLTNVVLNAGLAEFPSAAFSGCSNLAELSPRTFTSCQRLYGNAFSGCSKLVGKFDFPVCVSVVNDVFSSCLFIEEVSIPAATSIGTSAFKNCASLAKVVVSKDLTQVGSSAFYGCVNLEPDFLQSILTKSIQHVGSTDVTKKGSEFYGCTSLKTLVWNLPNLATNLVASSCFYGCSSLEKVVFKTPVDEIRSKAFYGIKPGAEIYMHQEVPAVIEREALSRYKDYPPYTKVYLSDNVDGWLEVLGKYHHVIPKDKFDDRTFYAEAPLMTCGKTTDHLKMSWQTMVNMMAKDTAVCESVKSGSNVTSVKMKERGVIAFVLCHNSNHGESCFWVMRAPQKGFSISIR